ncbi:MAG: YdiU family protein [Candidatus Sericytochromatia bacterium]|nr:YdiU family protein [Candidatus Sericytochromatia bacterium]
MRILRDSPLPPWRFDNAWLRELPVEAVTAAGSRQVHGAASSRVTPSAVAAPRLLAYSAEVAALLGLPPEAVASEAFAEVFGGNALAPGMEPWATCYGGHQFGAWAGQLGDGRALSLGEVLAEVGQRWELQLKGAGPTPYSRGSDGRAVLRSSVREFLCSEAMHHLGVPTTRALSLVLTGDAVVRDMFYDGNPRPEPGAVVCRVAPSFLRFGHLELPAARGDVGLLGQLAAFALRRCYPELGAPGPEGYAAMFREVCTRTAEMVAGWMRVGFVHGVMNTDNMSLLGQTLDYGPYGWMEDFDPRWTPNTTDRTHRRYAFGQQPAIAMWNLVRLAEALSPLIEPQALLQEGLDAYADAFNAATRRNVAAKLGLDACRGDEDLALGRALEGLMQRGEVDMTLFYRGLAEVDVEAPTLAPVEEAFYDAGKREAVAEELVAWLGRWAARVRDQALPPATRRAAMNRANPRYVLRNYLAQEAIDAAAQGDAAGIAALLEVMRRPYDEQPGREAFARRRPEWARHRAGCSMLSCSS